MATFGVDNFLGELSLDGTTANFHFTDPDDTANVADVSISPKEFPEGVVSPDSREVSDYAYSLVSKQLNDKRSERLKAANVKLEVEEQDRLKAERAATAEHLSSAEDSKVAAAGEEKREDGVKQTVYNTAAPSTKQDDKKK
jgi:hypothetical protein